MQLFWHEAGHKIQCRNCLHLLNDKRGILTSAPGELLSCQQTSNCICYGVQGLVRNILSKQFGMQIGILDPDRKLWCDHYAIIEYVIVLWLTVNFSLPIEMNVKMWLMTYFKIIWEGFNLRGRNHGKFTEPMPVSKDTFWTSMGYNMTASSWLAYVMIFTYWRVYCVLNRRVT